MIKWIRKNWIIILGAVLAVILIYLLISGIVKSLSESYKKDIKASDERIAELNKEIREKDTVIAEAIEAAREWETKVAEKEAIITRRDLRIRGLERKEEEIEKVVAELPPSEIVSRTVEILECAEIKLQDQGIIFSLVCAKKNLTILEGFTLVKEQRDLFRSSLTDSLEALQFQKMATFNVWRVSWAQRSQILNWQDKYKEKDSQFDLCQKSRKARWFNGLWKGVVIGVALTIAVRLLAGK